MSDNIDDELEEICPYCAVKDGCEHLLARIDCTFGEQGEGELGAGVISGPLIDAVEVVEICDAIRLYWVEQASLNNGAPVASEWMKKLPGVTDYFDALGSAGGFEIDDYEDYDDASADLACCTNYHAAAIRDLIEAHLCRCGWNADFTRWETDEFMNSSAMLTWWDLDPQQRVSATRLELKKTLSVIQGHAASGE
jgi:hypothetical protein